MDPLIVLLLYGLLAAIIVLFFARLVLRRRARRTGSGRAEARKDRQAGGDGLGATMTLSGDLPAVRTLVAPIFDDTRRVRYLGPDSWAHTHYTVDDVVYELTRVDGGTLVAVSRAIEFAGTLNGVKAWASLRARIAAAASERGIAVTEGVRRLVRSGGPAGAVEWRPRG